MHKFIEGTIAAVIGVLIFATLLVPITVNAQTQVSTEELNTTERYIMAGSSEDVIIEATANGWEINGELVTLPTPYFAVAFGEKGVIRFGTTTASIHTDTERIGNIVKFEYSEGVLTITKNDNTTISEEWAYLFYPSNNGNYGMFEHIPGIGEPINVDKNVKSYFIANTAWNNTIEFWGAWEIVNGEVTNNIVPFCYATSYNGTINIDQDATVDIVYTPSEDGLTNLYEYGTVTSQGVTYSNQSFIVAPLAYHIHTQTDNAVLQIIGLLPLILIFALIMGILGVALYQRIE